MIYSIIVESARAAIGAKVVLMTRLDHEGGNLYIEASSGLDPKAKDKLVNTLAGTWPCDGVAGLARPTEANPCWRAVFLQGKPFSMAATDNAEGWLDADVLSLVGADLGLAHAIVCPLMVWNRVEGTFSFYSLARFSRRQRRVCEAFAHQAGLILESAVLCDVLQVQLDQVQQSRRHLTEAEERLRREVAELLHGRVQNHLLVVFHQLSRCEQLLGDDPEEARELLANARRLLNEVREQDIRQASHRLHPSIIKVGLIPAVRSLSVDYEGWFKTNLEISAEVQVLDNPLHNRIAEGLRLTVYRVLAEALNNINRHANASRAGITLEINGEGKLQVTVRDDGCGFDPAKVERGLGLEVIAGRVEQVGGVFQITSAPGQGTTLSAFFSLDDQTTG